MIPLAVASASSGPMVLGCRAVDRAVDILAAWCCEGARRCATRAAGKASSRAREGSSAMTTGRLGESWLPRLHRPQETFQGLPPEVWQVHQLQQKTSWSAQDHARIVRLTRRWTDAHRRIYEDRWNWGRAARWH